MDVVGSEIGQKMRSAIKAKLTELGCYVDDELPDYVMVMVANKRTRAQMEDDLQLFLGDNTELFVNWLHQVLKKLQEVTVAAPKPSEPEKSKEKEKSHSKEKKTKDRKSKEKSKKSDLKKAKKKEKEKEKLLRKKEQKKAHKKKKSKDREMIRPNIPPLLMNMEKDSEPSITDVFAGQILKNHGILIEPVKEDPKETKPVLKIAEAKRPILPIIDPATILATPNENTEEVNVTEERASVSSGTGPREDQLKEMKEIEAKIQGLRQKLAEQLDSMSEDEDFLNIRTEAEELMNDFAEDVFQEISEQTPAVPTPPDALNSPTPPLISPKPTETSKDPVETLPQIELKLPKRPIRERLGVREEQRKPEKQKEDHRPSKSPESFTPERELEPSQSSSKSAKSRIGVVEQKRKNTDGSNDKTDSSSKRLTSRVSVLEPRSSGRSTCASVVRVRPRPRVPAPSSSLLLRAVADAHKSLVNLPPKIVKDLPTVKRALVLPMRRVDLQNMYVTAEDRPGTVDDTEHDAISLGDPDSDDDKSSKITSDAEKDEYVPSPMAKKNPNEYGPSPLIKKVQNEYAPGLTMKIQNTEYVPSHRLEGRTASRKDDSIVIEAVNIHNPSVGKDKNTQFIVTMDGFNPNAFLAKKLQTEGLLNDDDEEKSKLDEMTKTTPTEKEPPKTVRAEITKENLERKRCLSDLTEKSSMSEKSNVSEKSNMSEKSNESDKSNVCDKSEVKDAVEIVGTPVVVKEEKVEDIKTEISEKEDYPPVKKRKSSPIVFDVGKKEKDREQIRARTESVGSDNHVTVTTTTNSHKYDTLPPLSAAPEKKSVWCRAFPACRYGASCAFVHPRCKFAAACTRRNCAYSHSAAAPPAAPPASPAPAVASHVVPAANYKSISAAPLAAMCKFYPSCVNPACHFYHPKPCRYGKLCGNKLECNFYHADVPAAKWRYSGP